MEYKKIAAEIPILKEHVVTMGMYDMHREELIKTLVMTAESLTDALINRCVKDYQAACKEYAGKMQERQQRSQLVLFQTRR